MMHTQVHLAKPALANHAADGVPGEFPLAAGGYPRGAPVDLRYYTLDLTPGCGVPPGNAAPRHRPRNPARGDTACARMLFVAPAAAR